jgi:GDP-L-fucose synthase
MEFLKGKRILITGGAGFLGTHTVNAFKAAGVDESNIIISRSRDYDLRKLDEAMALIEKEKPQLVVNIAARLGGIGDNRRFPASYFYDNLMIGVNMIEACRKQGVEKLTNIGTVCSYPKILEAPFKEEDLWNGYPEETNAPYGVSKKAVMVYGEAAYRQYGFKNINLLLTNLYGPGDDFREETSHVIPAIIKKIVKAKDYGLDHIEAWGDGSPSRDFLYVEDAAEAIVLATAKYEDPYPVNIGAGKEIKVKELIEILAEQIGFEGEVRWDTSKPNGQPRRLLDVSKAEKGFGFRSETPFRQGLKNTIDWYLSNRETIDNLAPKFEDSAINK